MERDVLVKSALQRHQLKQWLQLHGVQYRIGGETPMDTFRITASAEKWLEIEAWLEKTKPQFE